MNRTELSSQQYSRAMGRLLVLYTQVDGLIMEVCAERIATAPNERARLGLAKQVGDESRHVSIQQEWMTRFGTDPAPVISESARQRIKAHFSALGWVDFLTDLYLCVEALGSQAVEQVVPLADPGTRESLRVPLSDELDHVAFGLSELRAALSALAPDEREQIIRNIPARIDRLADILHGFGMPLPALFEDVGADYPGLCQVLAQRRDELVTALAA